MSRIETLNALTAGISRLRNVGGADPGTLYDLLNGFVTIAGTIQSRPGTTDGVDLPAGSKGLCAFDGGMVVFASTLLVGMPTGFRCEVLVHPTNAAATISEIWFAGAFLGFLYVVAEFSDGEVFHYWLQSADAWEASHAYGLGELVEPTVRNGYVYRAKRLGDPGIVWAPNVARTIGDIIEPTTPNGFAYECTDTLGANPRSGTTEPTWPTVDGATVSEDTDIAPPTTPTTSEPPSESELPDIVQIRYGTLDDGYGGIYSEPT